MPLADAGFRCSVATTLADLPLGQSGVLAEFDLAPDDAARLMELGFLPGVRVLAVRAAPGGDPRVFRVDGAEVALRRETARHLMLRTAPA
jgi:ferrous iron transport protein A